MKKLIILGGTGFIGECFIDFFLNKNIKKYKLSKLILIGRDINKIKKKYNLKNKNIFLKKINLNKKLNRIPKADFILHAAENYDNSSGNKLKDYTKSFNLTKRICNYYNKIKFPTKMIFVSSGAVYGKNIKKKKFLETQKINKNNFKNLSKNKKNYALNKFKSETYIRKNFKKDYEIIRLFSVIGKQVPQDKNYVVGNFIKDSKLNDRIVVNSKNPNLIFRSFVNSKDLIIILIKLFFLNRNYKSVYNVGSEEYVSILKLSKLFSNYSKKKVQLINKKNKYKNEIDFYVPNINKLKYFLKIKKTVKLNRSIIECLK